MRQPELNHQRDKLRSQQFLLAVEDTPLHLTVIRFVVPGEGGLLIKARAAARQRVFQQGPPAHAAATFFRHIFIIDKPAVTALERRMSRRLLGHVHHLIRRLTETVGADTDVHQRIAVN
ncbi:hypothetical protein SRABI106_00417 [Rahnella aquatilis]|nr:hypothetical protein SRABI106_00417 [Rahnella aquatilis]